MYKVDVYLRVRRAVMVEGMSIQETARTFGLHRDTVRKMLAYSVPPGYRRQSPPRKPKLEPFTSVIDRILEDDLRRPRKQRHTVKRIFERLRDEYGFDGQYTIVKDYVREHRRQTKEMFVPLSHPPGHAQCDFGEALVVIGGIERKAHCFVLDLPHSDGCFVKAYPAETTEAFLDGHVSPSPSWAGCPRASSTTTPSWRWPGSWGMDAVNAPAPSPSCSLTTCSRTGSASPARAMTKAKWRAWWGTCAETSWCRCRPSRALMHSMHTWSDVAWNEWTPSSGDIRRPSASVWSGTWTPVAAAASSIRRLQEAVGPGELVVAGPVQDQRLLGAGGLRIPGRAGKRIRGLEDRPKSTLIQAVRKLRAGEAGDETYIKRTRRGVAIFCKRSRVAVVEGMKEIVQLMEEWQLNVGDLRERMPSPAAAGCGISSANTSGARAMARAMVVGPRVVGYPGG